MKLLKYIFPILFTVAFISCNEDDDVTEISETENLKMVQELTNDTHIVELYTAKGALELGYNAISIRIKDKQTQNYIETAEINWKPLMHMTTMSHACPYSTVEKVAGKKSLFAGYIVFQMPENDMEKWNLDINYKVEGVDFTATSEISVPQSTKKRVSVITGSDAKRYVIALIDPTTPEVKVNDMMVGVYTMESMMSFPVVENLKLNLDPRMPSMGNHSSPNNQDLTFDSVTKMYKGKLSLTMTGYWKLNLILRNAADEILKGEAVTAENESSSLYLEIEF